VTVLYKYIDSRSIRGLLLAGCNRENSLFLVLIQVQTEIPNFVQFELCVSLVFPYL
jgi:hypothetical protein